MKLKRMKTIKLLSFLVIFLIIVGSTFATVDPKARQEQSDTVMREPIKVKQAEPQKKQKNDLIRRNEITFLLFFASIPGMWAHLHNKFLNKE